MKPSPDFAATRALFDLPEGVIYLDGNSLGPLPKAARQRVAQAVSDEWGAMLITGWNKAGWMDQPRRLGERIGRLIGAEPGTVMVGDTLSLKMVQVLAAALEMQPGRKVILSDNGNFPSDLYMAQGLIGALGQGHVLRTPDPEHVEAALGPDVAVLMLTEVDYRSARRHDMARLTRLAQAQGILTIWDLAHSAGAVPVDLAGCNADFAAGCTYKYLNGGPGSPGFAYVAPRHQTRFRPMLSGWLGHDAPFAFEGAYRPAAGIGRLRIGTPPVIAMAALEAALDVWDGLEVADVFARSQELTELFIAECARVCPELELASPSDPDQRGSHLAFRHRHAYPVMQALIAGGVIGDFRAPDVLRFGFAPLYLNEQDIGNAVAVLAGILRDRSWDRPEYHQRAAVT